MIASKRGWSKRDSSSALGKRAMGSWLTAVSLLVVGGCGSNDNPGGSVGDLSGVWDVIGSSPSGAHVELVLTLDAQHIEVIGAGGSFSALPQGSGFVLTYSVGARSAQVLALRENGGSMHFGAIPLDLSGLWSFRTTDFQDNVGCNATLMPGALSGTCAEVSLPNWVSSGYRLSRGSASGDLTATAPSSFGDLGGSWLVTTPSGVRCDFDFANRTFSSKCGNGQTGKDLGGLIVTFSGATASGTTTQGIEFSAHRR
jgi:hypothetical protein